MKKTKRMLSLFLVILIALSTMPPITASAVDSNDLSEYVTVTGFKIYNKDNVEVESSDHQQGVSEYESGLFHWSKCNVEINWELKLPLEIKIKEGDFFKISMFTEERWSIGNTAISNVIAEDVGVVGTWSIKSKVAIVSFNDATEGKSLLNGTLTTGEICYPKYMILEDQELPTTMSTKQENCTQYYKYNKRGNSNAGTRALYFKDMASSTNYSITWDLHVGQKYLTDKASVFKDAEWPGTPTETMTGLFVIDRIENASSITDLSTIMQTRFFAKGPGGSNEYKDYPLGSMDLASLSITDRFVSAGNGTSDPVSRDSYVSLEDFKTYVQSQSKGVGSYGIYREVEKDIYYVVWYLDFVPTTNLTYGNILGKKTSDYLKDISSIADVVDGSEDWYDEVYGENDPIYNLLIRVFVAYDPTNPVLTGSQPVGNEVSYEYYKDQETHLTDSRNVTGHMYAASAKSVLPPDNVALIKYDSEGTTGLEGATFKLQYLGDSEIWLDYKVDGVPYEGITAYNGQLLIKDLPEGDYRFVETTAATGYDKETAKYYASKEDIGSNPITGDKHFTIPSKTDGSYIYATNDKAKYRITYDSNKPEGTTVSNDTVDNNTYEYGETATIEKNQYEIANYQFIGWMDKNKTSYAEGGSIKITEDTTLYAQWEYDNPIMVIYNANCGTGHYEDGGKKQGSLYDVLNIEDTGIKYPGHKFVGWNTKQDGTGTQFLGKDGDTSFLIPTENITLYAQWEDILYQVEYHPNEGVGGKTIPNLTYKSIHTVLGNAPVDVSRKDFDFACWNTEPDGSGQRYKMNDEIEITEDVVLYAQWKEREEKQYHTLTYDSNGGAGEMASRRYGDGETVIVQPNAFTKTDHKFAGFMKDGDSNLYASDSDAIENAFARFTISSDEVLKAQWIYSGVEPDDTYTITYYANGGDGTFSETVAAGELYTFKTHRDTGISYTGHTFIGWNTDPKGNETGYVPGYNTPINQDITLYAQWSNNNYSVTYNANEGKGDDYQDTGFLFGEEYTVKSLTETEITRSGYTFKGWNTKANGTGTPYSAGDTFEISDNVTLYAQWTKKSGGGGSTTFTVTYNANGGTGSHSDSNLSSGATYTVKSQSATGITRDKYTFTGWNTKADGTGTTYAAADTFKISSNVTLYAKWKSSGDDSLLNTEDHMAYVIGYTDGTVKPTANITRAEVATIYFRLLTENARNNHWSTSNTYSDVNAENWFNNAVSTMSNANIITGYTDGTFVGNRNITRAEFAAIAARFDSGTYSGGDKFSDISGHWAAEYINRAAEKGWITGYEDGTFNPNQYITRAEAMTLINRVLGRDDIAGMHADMNTWSDNPSTAWYYEAVQEATNSHEYTRDSTTNAETWTKVTSAPDWAALEKSWSTANSI